MEKKTIELVTESELQKYLKAVRALKVADAQPEVLTFMATIDDAGLITYQSPSVRVTPGYMFACEEIRGGCPCPPQMTDDVDHARMWTIAEFLPFISFNVFNAGQNRQIFKTPLQMNMFVNAEGSHNGLTFKTPIAFFEGADITVQWFVDVLSLLQTWSGHGTARSFNPAHDPADGHYRTEFYAHLIGSLVRSETVV